MSRQAVLSKTLDSVLYRDFKLLAEDRADRTVVDVVTSRLEN